MQYISLDQCFLRTLLWPKGDARFIALRSALEKAIGSKKVICPSHPNETICESILLPDEQREEIIAFLNRLSKGYGFRTFHEELALETLELIRPRMESLPLLFGEIRFKADADLHALAEEIRDLNRKAVEKVNSTPYPPKGY